MKSIILLGNGGHCKSCIDVIENSNEFCIKGIISKNPQINSGTFMNYEFLGMMIIFLIFLIMKIMD